MEKNHNRKSAIMACNPLAVLPGLQTDATRLITIRLLSVQQNPALSNGVVHGGCDDFNLCAINAATRVRFPEEHYWVLKKYKYIPKKIQQRHQK